jgi:DNA-binding NtrC family response regulator
MEKSVLLVDDEEYILTLLGRIFQDLGWEVFTAKNADDALHLFQKTNVPLIVTDLRLQDGVGGVNVAKESKNISPLTIVIAMSGLYDESYSVSHLRRAGFDHMIEKPVKISAIKSIVDATTICRIAWDRIKG